MKPLPNLLISSVILTVLVVPALAQEQGHYYPETGHTLDQRFVAYFDAHGGLELLGYPITDSFIDPSSGLLVQYTQNARLEFFPDRNKGDLRPRLNPLGETLGGWEMPYRADQGLFGYKPGCRFYPLSGHNVCHVFLDYYEGRGGPAVFGYPISEFLLENGRIVQYFQGFRLDWNPENRFGSQVIIAPLGRAHFEIMGYDPRLLWPNPTNDSFAYREVELQAQASVWKPVVGPNDSQYIFVVVRDQNLIPVQGAAVILIASFPEGERLQEMPPTDVNGVSQWKLTLTQQSPGSMVRLEFMIAYGGFLTSTRDSFHVWW